MSVLIDSLNRIKVWMQNHYPQIAVAILSGLRSEEIEKIVCSLPYKLPQEVYELHQWFGGLDNPQEDGIDCLSIFAPYDYLYYLDLQEAAARASDQFDLYDDDKINQVRYLGKSLFPVFGSDKEDICVVRDWKERYSSPILHVSNLNEVTLRYISLTSMLQTTAQLWESGVAFIDTDGFVQCPKQRFSAVYRQFNSELPQLVLARLKQELELAGNERNNMWKPWANCNENIYWLTEHWPGLSYKQFAPELIEPIVRETNKDNEADFSLFAISILKQLGYRF